MSKIFGICSLLSFLSFLVALTTAIWTEKDEAKRIAQIKSDEQRLYEDEMGEKLPPLSGGTSEEDIITGDRNDGLPPPLLSPPPKLRHSLGLHRHHFPSVSAAADHLFFNSSFRHSADEFWCFHCASPWNAISEPMQRVVKNLLDIRRAHYPTAEIVRRECVHPRELDQLPRQICRGYSHCQTLILTDHSSGSAFTMRGCAERFGAVDAQVLARRGDNTCKSLHEKVDIQECICERRKYCHAGNERPFSLRFTPMSEWHQRGMPSSSSASPGQPQKNVWPSAEALQRNKGQSIREQKQMIGIIMGMGTMMTMGVIRMLGDSTRHDRSFTIF